MTVVLIGAHIVMSLLVVLLILLHRGAGGGLSDMFGGGAASTQGSAVVERNLNRLTVAAVVGFTITTILLRLTL